MVLDVLEIYKLCKAMSITFVPVYNCLNIARCRVPTVSDKQKMVKMVLSSENTWNLKMCPNQREDLCIQNVEFHILEINIIVQTVT